MKQGNIRGLAVILVILLLAVGFAYAEGTYPRYRAPGFIVWNNYFNFNNTQATNLTNITFNNVSNYTAAIHYIDILDNNTVGDLVFRSRDTTGAITERFRMKAQTNAGGAVVFTEINLPTARPITPLNGSYILNLTDNSTEVYANGAWHYSGNGTVKN